MLSFLQVDDVRLPVEHLSALSDGLEEVPDDWDLEMIKAAREENDGTVVSIDDLAQELGVTL